MKRKLTAITLFVVVIAIITAFQMSFNSRTPILRSGDVLTDEVLSRHLIVMPDEAHPDEFVLRADADLHELLTLTLSDMGAVRILCDGAVLYESTQESAYLRTQQVSLPPDAVSPGRDAHIRIEADDDYKRAKEVITGTSIAPFKVYLSSTSQAQRASLLSFGIVAATMGIYLVIFIICTILYIGKRSEKYLLTLSMIAVICFFTSLFTSNNPLMTAFSFEDYVVLRPLLSLCPLLINAAVCLYLCEDAIPRRWRRVLSIPMLVLLTLLLLLARMVTRISFYAPARFILLIPVVWALSCAYERRMRGSLLLTIGYAVGESVTVAFFIIYNLRLCRSGPMMGYANLSHMCFLPMMLCALCVVGFRFAQKYQESEQLTQALQEMNAQLDEKVAQRTAQLVDEQQRRRNLLLNIIHDIKSPIFILLGYLNELKISPSQENLRAVMLRKLSDVKHLVEDLFMTTRMEEDSVFYEEDRLPADALIRELYDEYGVEAARRRIHLTLEAPERLHAVLWADRLRLRQAIQNLLDNAFTYTPDGGTVRICCAESRETLSIDICDTGKGIAAEDLPFVFERYFHAHHADNPKSSGLGLSIAREIIEHSRGSIFVTSELHVGTVFHVRLPVVED